MEKQEQVESKEVVLEFFKVLFNKDFFDMGKMESLLGENFEQHADGRIRSRAHLLKHFEGHIKMKQSSDVDFKIIYSKDYMVFALYHITSHKAKGTSATWQVLAKFEVRNGKLDKMEQLSELLPPDSN